nr:hypothetical protein asmbl_9 [uncultured bacterium]
MRWFWDQYAPHEEMRRNPLAALLCADDADLAALLPTLLITAGAGVLRDEGGAVRSTPRCRRCSGDRDPVLDTIHAFTVLSRLADTPAARAALDHAGHVLRRGLRP